MIERGERYHQILVMEKKKCINTDLDYQNRHYLCQMTSFNKKSLY
jgi:hypothetical protein